MTTTETITVRLAKKDKAMLGRLAADTRRSKSFLAAEAIHAYIAQEAEIIKGIREGLEDERAGRLIDNETAYKGWLQVINKASKKTRS